MVLKRKRSDSEMSTSSSLFSSPPGASSFMALDHPQYTIPTPSLFSSRTRKRYRNNRPSESEVHQHTLSILFGAQQPQNHPQSPSSPSPAQSSISVISDTSSIQQSSLHSFWALPSKPRQTSLLSSSSVSNTSFTTPPRDSFMPATNCEDCSISLKSTDDEDAMDVDMMAMDESEGNYGCTSCGKQVCHGCAVSNLGADRKCLSCAKPKRAWQGGLGWVSN